MNVKELMKLHNNEALDGDELEELHDYLRVANADIEEKEFFSSIRICRDDIINCHEDDEEYEERATKYNEITDMGMKWIAEKYSEACCETDYYNTLEALADDWLERKKWLMITIF